MKLSLFTILHFENEIKKGSLQPGILSDYQKIIEANDDLRSSFKTHKTSIDGKSIKFGSFSIIRRGSATEIYALEYQARGIEPMDPDLLSKVMEKTFSINYSRVATLARNEKGFFPIIWENKKKISKAEDQTNPRDEKFDFNGSYCFVGV